MKKMRTREAVVVTVLPMLAILATGAALGLLWPTFGGWCLFLAFFPVLVILTVHPVYRLVIRPHRVRRELRKRGIPTHDWRSSSHGKWRAAVEFERSSNRDFTSWKNPLLLLALHEHYSGYAWIWDCYERWAQYDLGGDWDEFFSKVFKHIPSTAFKEESKVPKAEPLVQALAEGKTNVTELSRLMRDGLSYKNVLMVAVEGMPVEYAREL